MAGIDRVAVTLAKAAARTASSEETAQETSDKAAESMAQWMARIESIKAAGGIIPMSLLKEPAEFLPGECKFETVASPWQRATWRS